MSSEHGPSALSSTDVGNISSPTRPLRILLVEDHADAGDMLRQLLQVLGYEVVLVRNMSSAATAADCERFDVLISDLCLPDGSGYGLLESLRTGSSAPPAIALSGHGLAEDRERSRAAGFVEHLVKPVDARDLEQAIERALEVA
jgi:two-component system CheB/CheR fusion protein